MNDKDTDTELPPPTFDRDEFAGDPPFPSISGERAADLCGTTIPRVPDTITVPINKAPWYIGEAQPNDQALEQPRQGKPTPKHASSKGVHVVRKPSKNNNRIPEKKLVYHTVVRHRKFGDFVRNGIASGLSRIVSIINRFLYY